MKVLYPLSADPITNGHLDIIKRASRLYEQVVVAIAQNLNKKYTFELWERLQMVEMAIKVKGFTNVEVVSYKGLTVDFAWENTISTIIKGVRNIDDYKNEVNQYLVSSSQKLGIELVPFFGHKDKMHISSSAVKELVLNLPEGENLKFQAGGYIQIDIPEYHNLSFSDFEIENEYHPDWDQYKIWDLVANNDEPVFRAYSMANHPAEGNRVMLNVRIATPPPALWNEAPPGLASSYIFNLKPGDKVTISGPYGEFFIKDTEREMVYIGGGAGMAPMRSHLFHLFQTLKTGRKVSFWYGARSVREMFYDEHFKEIENKFPNFSYNVALSEPMEEDNWSGHTGFIHQVLHDEYLKNHEDPTEIEYYMCGPPPMINACDGMLDSLGVDKEMIAYDSFG